MVEAALDSYELGDNCSGSDRLARVRAYVNCELFATLVGADERASYALRVFLYARPLCAVAQSDALQRAVDIEPPRNGTESWYPVRFEALPNDIAHYRVYRTLVLRIAFLLRLIKQAHERKRADDASDGERERCATAEYRLYHWLDAHLMLTLAIDELGYVPRDDSGAMAALLECYSPDVNMALTETELPDLSRELRQCEFLSHRSASAETARREWPLVELFMKALPMRNEVRDLATNAADLSVSDAGAFGLIKLLLAASFLGVYRRAEYRAGWRMRYAVYKLFFFTPDQRLLRYCTTSTSASVEKLRSEFGMEELIAEVEREHGEETSGQRSPRRKRATGHVQYTDYCKLVYDQFSAVHAEFETGVKERSATSLRKGAVRASDATSAPSKKRVSDAAGDVVQTTRVDQYPQGWYAKGIEVANAVARATVEKGRGEVYYEQLKAAGALPPSGVDVARDSAQPCVPPPAERGERVEYRSMYKRVAPCDRVLPRAHELARDEIVYRWLTAATIARRRSATNELGASQREYLFQNKLVLALRQYLIFGLERWHEAVRRELFARIDWGRWERRVWHAGDAVRAALDRCYVSRRSWLGAFLNNYATHRVLTQLEQSSGSLNTHYETESDPFLDALMRLMQAEITSNGFSNKPVDHVLPRETELLIKHLLGYYRYPRFAPPLLCEVAPPSPPAAAAPETRESTNDGCVFEQYRESIVPAQLAYLIEPVGASALPLGTRVDSAWIQRELVDRARFPLGIFHADEQMLRRFAHVRTQYHLMPTDDVLHEFIEWLTHQSAYQFYLLHAYVSAVYRHLNIYSVPLPRHIAEHQLRSLRNYYCVPPDRPVPRNLLSALVCVDCQRCALTFVEPGQPHSSMATGNNSVRFLPRTDDDDVLEHLRQRNFRPLPLAALRPAKSYTYVLQRRLRSNARAYDRFVDEPTDAHPCHDAENGGVAPHQSAEQFAADVFAGRYDCAEPGAQTDRRRTLYETAPFERAELGELRLVARGMGRLGELDFESALWRETERRMRLVADYGERASVFDAPNRRSFLLLGHSAANADPRFGSVKWVDACKRQKTEGKKFKQHKTQGVRIDRIFDEAKRAQEQVKHDTQARKDAFNMGKFVKCSRQQMLEIDLCGRALRADALTVNGKERRLVGEVIVACNDCLAPLRARHARPIADRVVCDTCYRASQRVGGAVALRYMSGAPKPSVARNSLAALSDANSRTTRSTERQLMLSPSFSALCDDVIPEGTQCIRHRCLKLKSGPGSMVGLEVLKDTDVGNETYGYVYFCTKHAATYAALFRLPTVIALSTLENFLLERKRNFDEVTASGTSFLDDVIRRAARSSSIGSAARAREAHESDERKEARDRRNKQKRSAACRIKRRRDNARERELRAPT